jgi:DNA-binding transcriptional LysR family regulator
MVRDDAFDGLAIFLKVLEAGSITGAAEQLGIAKSTVSTRIAGLEAKVGVRLLSRSRTGVAPTEAGRRMLAHGRRLLAEADAALEDVRGDASAPSGLLRVSAPSGMVDALVIPLIAEFLHRYPRVRLDLVATDAFIDLRRTDVDVALRFGWVRDGDVIARELAAFDDLLCAAPDHLARSGPVATLEDLAHHPWIAFSGFGGQTQTQRLIDRDDRPHEVPVTVRVRTSHAPSVRDWALAGLGIVRVPRFLVETDLAGGRLVAVLPDYRLESPSLYAVHLRERYRRPAVKALLAHLEQAFQALRPPPGTAG